MSASSMSASANAARIGFQLPGPDAHDITGYCAAEMAIADFNGKGVLPFPIELVPILENHDPDNARRGASN